MSELGWLGLFFIGLGFLAWFLERPPRRLFQARPMARRGVSEKRQKAAAVQGALRQMAQGERPLYRVRMIRGGGWTVIGAEWLSGTAATRSEALAAARAALAAMLDVDADRFDVEASTF